MKVVVIVVKEGCPYCETAKNYIEGIRNIFSSIKFEFVPSNLSTTKPKGYPYITFTANGLQVNTMLGWNENAFASKLDELDKL